MKRSFLRIGTRGSPLALAQARLVQKALEEKVSGLSCEIVPITTTGDRLQKGLLSEIGGKGLFTKEIEEALLAQQIDCAVHSMKDMPTIYPKGLIVPCMLEREDPRDVLLSLSPLSCLADLPQGSHVGTASLRRRAQLLYIRPDLRLSPLRGNVGTRLTKLSMKEIDATILALAGMKRLGLDFSKGYIFSPEEMIPAVAQGAIGVECREKDTKVRTVLEEINHPETFSCVQGERAFLKVLDGSCRTPMGSYASVQGGRVLLRGFLSLPTGENTLRAHIEGPLTEVESLGVTLALRLKETLRPGFFPSLHGKTS